MGPVTRASIYKTADDDTVRKIAIQLGIEPVDLVAANRKKYSGLTQTSRLRKGTELRIPPPKGGCDSEGREEGFYDMNLPDVVAYRHWTFPNDPIEYTHASYMMVRPLMKRDGPGPCMQALHGHLKGLAGDGEGKAEELQQTKPEPQDKEEEQEAQHADMDSSLVVGRSKRRSAGGRGSGGEEMTDAMAVVAVEDAPRGLLRHVADPGPAMEQPVVAEEQGEDVGDGGEDEEEMEENGADGGGALGSASRASRKKEEAVRQQYDEIIRSSYTAVMEAEDEEHERPMFTIFKSLPSKVQRGEEKKREEKRREGRRITKKRETKNDLDEQTNQPV